MKKIKYATLHFSRVTPFDQWFYNVDPHKLGFFRTTQTIQVCEIPSNTSLHRVLTVLNKSWVPATRFAYNYKELPAIKTEASRKELASTLRKEAAQNYQSDYLDNAFFS